MMSIKISHDQFNQEINLKSDNHNTPKTKTKNKQTFWLSKATISQKQVQIDIIVNKIRQSKLIKNELTCFAYLVEVLGFRF